MTVFTPHANKRWQERLPHLNRGTEWETAKPVGKRLRVLLAGPTPKVPPSDYRPARYMISTNGVIFVCDMELRLVITVFHVRECKRRQRRKKAERRTHFKYCSSGQQTASDDRRIGNLSSRPGYLDTQMHE